MIAQIMAACERSHEFPSAINVAVVYAMKKQSAPLHVYGKRSSVVPKSYAAVRNAFLHP